MSYQKLVPFIPGTSDVLRINNKHDWLSLEENFPWMPNTGTLNYLFESIHRIYGADKGPVDKSFKSLARYNDNSSYD